MYSGEYDACDVTLSVYPHRTSFKNMSKKNSKNLLPHNIRGASGIIDCTVYCGHFLMFLGVRIGL
jgi:hypothetical protein